MSANLVVDIGGTCTLLPSLIASGGGNNSGGIACGLSGVFVGYSADLNNANTYCNLIVMGDAILTSGPLVIQVQTADSDVSGAYGDPTSGLAYFPTQFQSGGNFIVGSGSNGYAFTSGVSGTALQSGFMVAAAFQRTGRYARMLFNGGFYIGPLMAGFVSQNRTTGSGGGFSYAPSSGVVNV